MKQQPIDEEIRQFLLSLAKALGMRVEDVLDLYFYVSPATVRLVEVVEQGGEIVGVRLAVKSRKRPDVWYYTSVGLYGAKCTCRGNAVGGKICRHIVIGLITWHMTSLLKKGRGVDLSRLAWLKS